MRTFARSAWLGLLSIMAVPGIPCAPVLAADAPSIIEQHEAAFRAAIMRGGRGMETLLDAEFIYNTMDGGSTDRESLMASLRDEVAVVTRLRRSCIRSSLDEGYAVVTGISHVSFLMEGGEFEMATRYLHVWRQRDDGWWLFARQVTPLSAEAGEVQCSR